MPRSQRDITSWDDQTDAVKFRVELATRGLSQREIAKREGVSRRAIRDSLGRAAKNVKGVADLLYRAGTLRKPARIS